jgi:Helix-turn-helix domain
MDERLKFIARVLDGEKMAVLCREFGISRKTGYKLINRSNDSGLEGLTDRSRRPIARSLSPSGTGLRRSSSAHRLRPPARAASFRSSAECWRGR